MKKSILIGAVSLLAVGAAQAAFITWGDNVAAFDSLDETGWISQQGTLVNAINASASTNSTVSYGGINWNNADLAAATNGITQNGVFVKADADSLFGSYGPGQFTSDPDGMYDAGIYNLRSITMSGLTVGQEYLVQFMGLDDRGTQTRNVIVGDGTVDYATSVTNGTAGIYQLRTNPTGQGGTIVGTFIADAGTQSISMFGSRNAADPTAGLNASTSQFNALQIRAVPEPATFGLLAVFGGGMLFMRRRFKR